MYPAARKLPQPYRRKHTAHQLDFQPDRRTQHFTRRLQPLPHSALDGGRILFTLRKSSSANASRPMGKRRQWHCHAFADRLMLFVNVMDFVNLLKFPFHNHGRNDYISKRS